MIGVDALPDIVQSHTFIDVFCTSSVITDGERYLLRLLQQLDINVVGLGVGNSIERDFLPHAESDFIYSIIVEETGIFGGLLVLMLYVMLLVRVWRIAQKCDKYFPAYLIIGLGLMMVVQALVNMAVSVGLFPVTGQTLPLISHGGTSIIITSFNMGMILSVSRYAQSVTEKAKALEMASANETQEFASSEGMQ